MRLLVIGAGGHAKVVVDTAIAAGWDIAGIVGMPGDEPEILGYGVSQDAAGIEADAFIVAIGKNRTRAAYFDQFLATGMPAGTVIHPSAVISSDAVIGNGSFVAAGAIVYTSARVGVDTVINTGCTIDHDCVIGDHALVGPLACLCGGVQVGDGSLIGAGSTNIPARSIAEWSVVGAGATVVSDLPAGSLAVGVPARVVRTTEE